MKILWNDELYHYGMPRRSGRYKWGSGKDPYHHGADGAGKKAKADYKEAKKKKKETSRAAMRAYDRYQVSANLHPVASTKYALSLGGANTKPRTEYGKKVTKKLDNRWADYNDKLLKNIVSRAEYKQAKAAYKQTEQYKKDRRKKIAAIAAGTTVAAAGAYFATHPNERQRVANMMKDATKGKYRPRDLSGVAKAGRANPNLKYGRQSYSSKKGLALPEPKKGLDMSANARNRVLRYARSKSSINGSHVDEPGMYRKGLLRNTTYKNTGGVRKVPSGYKFKLKPKYDSNDIGASTSTRMTARNRKLTKVTPYGAYTKRNPNHNLEPYQVFNKYRDDKKYREPGAASTTGQKIYRKRKVKRLR